MGHLAWAGQSEVWASLYDGRLSESLQGDTPAALSVYEALEAHLEPSDPLRGEVSYWMARSWYAQGEADRALDALDLAKRDSRLRDSARELEVRINLTLRQVQSLPSMENFSLDTGPLVRTWERGDVADLQREPTSRGTSVVWRVSVEDEREDSVIFQVSERAGTPRFVSIAASSSEFPAVLRLVAVGGAGWRWEGEPTPVGVDQWAIVELQMPSGPGSTGPYPDLRLVLQDLTAFHGRERGTNTILLDDLKVE
jgi:hypothetical protein